MVNENMFEGKISELKELAIDINMLRTVLHAIEKNYDTLVKVVDFEKQVMIEYESLGILNPDTYELNSKHHKSMYRRARAIKELVDVFKDTEASIIPSRLENDCLKY